MSQKIKNDAERAEPNQVNFTEIKEIMQEETGRKIPPYKMAVLFKQADQIVNKLVNLPNWLVTYDDIESPWSWFWMR